MDLFSPELRRNPYPAYAHMREASPVFREPTSGLWLVFGYADVKRVLIDHEAFSSRAGPPEWMLFQDPPRHSRMRALIAQAFTPGSIEALEAGIRVLTRELLDPKLPAGEMDFAADFAVPLPRRVIGTMPATGGCPSVRALDRCDAADEPYHSRRGGGAGCRRRVCTHHR